MRRWNGWGDDTFSYAVPGSAKKFLEKRVGPGTPPHDRAFEDVLTSVPSSRLPAHPLVSDSAVRRLFHARGQSLPDWIFLRSGRIPFFPDGVAHPTTGEQVRQLISYALEVDATVIPYGGGTSVLGHINPGVLDRPVLTVDLGRLSRLSSFDEKSRTATFGAGIAGPDIEAQLRARGHTLGHFPQSFEFSTLGGWVSTRSTGQQSLGYGRIEDMFKGGKLQAPAGTLELPVFPASAAGPDIREMVLGSEGRLGILTEVTVSVRPLPLQEDFHAVFFPDFERGLSAVRKMVQSDVPLSMLRLSTAVETETTLVMAGHEHIIGGLERFLSLRGIKQEKCMMLFGLTGSDSSVKMSRKRGLGMAREFGGVHVGRSFGRHWKKSRFRGPYLRNTLWEMGYAVDTLETATSWSNVPAMVEAIEYALHSALLDKGENVHVFSHLSHAYVTGSSIYTTYLFRIASEPEQTLERWKLLKRAASKAVIRQGGTISHQHGVGEDHVPYLPAEKGALGMSAIRGLCKAFDPKGTMNPGKLFLD